MHYHIMRACFAIVPLLTFLSLAAAASSAGRAVAKASGPPSFFIRDMTDGLCLGGEIFKRCGIDTLWFVEGKAGAYQLHRRLVDEVDLELCLGKTHCHLEDSPTRLSNCNHCGTQKWNILGDEVDGYYITQDRERYCLLRSGDNARMLHCDGSKERFAIKFATKRDITLMSSDGARFVLAAGSGDMDAVMALLLKKVSPDVRDWEQRTPLLAAAASGSVDMLKYLLEKHASMTLSDRDDVTVLVEAVISGHLDALRYLLAQPEAKMIINHPAASGATALWFAAAEGKDEMIELLVMAGADVNKERQDGISPLIAAAAGGHTTSVEKLIKSGAEVLHRTHPEGLTALVAACENGSLPLISTLVESGSDINTLTSAGFSPLIVSAANGFEDTVRFLLDHGADPDLPHPENITALMYAAAGGHTDTVEILLSPYSNGEKGSTIHRKHKLGGTALMEAATAGALEVYELLLKNGANSHDTDNDGVSVLMTASSHGRNELVRLILSYDRDTLDVNTLSDSGGTALMYAAGGGHAETCRILVQEGYADVNVGVRASPAYISRVNKTNLVNGSTNSAIEVLDVEHSDGGTALTVAAEGGFLNVVQVLVDAGADLHVVADDNRTALTYAYIGGHSAICVFLLQRGADPNGTYVDDMGVEHNLLYDSIRSSNETISLELIRRGADVAHKDADGVDLLMHAVSLGLELTSSMLLSVPGVNWMPLHSYLIIAASEGYLAIVEDFLSRNDCDINGVDNDGSTALMAACARGQREVVDVLLQQELLAIDAQNNDGHTALMFANNGISQLLNMFEKLKEHINDNGEDTSIIIKDAVNEYQEIISLLMKSGADPALQDKDGHIAADFNLMADENLLANQVPLSVEGLSV